MIFFLQKLNYFQSLGPFLDIGICTIELINLVLGVQDEYIIMIQWRACKRDLHQLNSRVVFHEPRADVERISVILKIPCQQNLNLFHSDYSFSSADIQSCFKLFFLGFFKSRCNTSLQRYNTWFEKWQKFVRFMALNFPMLDCTSSKNHIKFNSFDSCSPSFILQ